MSLNVSREQAIEDFTKCAALIPEGMDPYECCQVPRTFEELHGLPDLPKDKDATPHLVKMEEWAKEPNIARWLDRQHPLTKLPLLLPSKQLAVGYALLEPILNCEGAQLCNREQIVTTSCLAGLVGLRAAAVLLTHRGQKALARGNLKGAFESIESLLRIRTFVARDPCLLTRYYEAAVLAVTCHFIQTHRGKFLSDLVTESKLLKATSLLGFTTSESLMWIGDMTYSIGYLSRPFELKRYSQIPPSSNDFIAEVFNLIGDPVLFSRAMLGLDCQSWVLGHTKDVRASAYALNYEDYLRKQYEFRRCGNLAEQVSAAIFPLLETLLQGFKMCEEVMRRTTFR